MFERFTDRARQVVVLSQDESRRLKHDYIGTEHLLLGLLREETGVAAEILASLDVALDDVRVRVERLVGMGDEAATGQIPFTPRAKKVLEFALREALSLGHNSVGTEHILLGLVRKNDGVAARVLLELDVDDDRVREAVMKRASGMSRARSQSSRSAWEYHVEYCDEISGERLNQLGHQGWELISINHAERYQLVFKRPR